MTDDAHDAGSDETMTYKQTGVFFCGAENRLKPTSIQVYFNKISHVYKNYYLTKILMATSCCLPVSRLSKIWLE